MNDSSFLRPFTCLAFLACLPTIATAANILWDGGGSNNNFSTAENWDGDVVPGINDYASFPLSANASVVLTGDTEVLGIKTWPPSNNPILSYDLGGFTLTTTSTDQHAGNFGIGALWMGSYYGQEIQWLFSNGTIEVETAFTLGGNGGPGRPPSVLRIQNGAILNSGTDSTLTSLVGRNGYSMMYVEAGGEWTSHAAVSMATSNSAASGSTVHITGTGATWNAHELVTVGQNHRGHMVVENEGTVAAANIRIGVGSGGANSSGSITGTGSSLSADNLYLGGSESSAGGASTLTVADGATGAVQELTVWGNSTLALSAGTLTTGGIAAGPSILHSDATLQIELFTPSQDAGLFAQSNLTISDALLALELDAAFSANIDDIIPLVRYDGLLTGTFFGLDEGSSLTVDDYTFLIRYSDELSGFDNSQFVTLQVIPEPAHYAGIFAVFCVLLAVLRKRKTSNRVALN